MPTEFMPTTAAFAKANGIELCYDSFGDPTALPLLLVMGLAGQMIAWDEEFCGRLAGRGYRVIRFDNRDIGLSTRFEAAGTPDVRAVLMAALLGRPIAAPYLLRDLADDAFTATSIRWCRWPAASTPPNRCPARDCASSKAWATRCRSRCGRGSSTPSRSTRARTWAEATDLLDHD